MYLIKKAILSALLSITLIIITPDTPLPASGQITVDTSYESGKENINTPTADKDDKDSTIH